MEIIEFTSYLENDKIEIAKHFLIPREKENNGLAKEKITFTKAALQEIIRYYVPGKRECEIYKEESAQSSVK